MVKLITRLEDLLKLFEKKYYQPEYRLYQWIIRTRGSFNKKRYLRALVKRLTSKGVIVTEDVIMEILYQSRR